MFGFCRGEVTWRWCNWVVLFLSVSCGKNGYDPTLDPTPPSSCLRTFPILKFIPSSSVSQLSQFLSSPEPSPGSRWVQGHSDSWAEGTKAPKSASSLGGAAPEPCARHSGQAARLGARHRAASLGTGSAEEVARRPPQHPQSGWAPGVTTSPLAGRHFLGRKEVSLRRACLGREGSCLWFWPWPTSSRWLPHPSTHLPLLTSCRHPSVMRYTGPIGPLKSNAASSYLTWELTFCTLSLQNKILTISLFLVIPICLFHFLSWVVRTIKGAIDRRG